MYRSFNNPFTALAINIMFRVGVTLAVETLKRRVFLDLLRVEYLKYSFLKHFWGNFPTSLNFPMASATRYLVEEYGNVRNIFSLKKINKSRSYFQKETFHRLQVYSRSKKTSLCGMSCLTKVENSVTGSIHE